jgi:polyisoprenoid-binding protein YceI
MATTKWVVDPTHSSIGFKVKHMMFTNVSGTFSDYTITAVTENEDFLHSNIEFAAVVDSVSTGNAQRDEHLKGADFFDAAQFPSIQFKATRYVNIDNDGSYELFGDLTIHGITKPVELSVEYGGLMKDPWGNIKAAFTINGKINRKEWGLNWNAALEAGGVLVSEEVRINCEIQLIKQA